MLGLTQVALNFPLTQFLSDNAFKHARPTMNENLPVSVADRGRRASIVGIGTANPKNSFTQDEVLKAFGIEDRRIRLMFRNSAIERRHLILPPKLVSGQCLNETQGDLLRKHSEYALEIGAKAIISSVQSAQATLADIRYLCCVTTTGFLTPGLSALMCKKLGLNSNCSRLDIVGMGCNAGLNGLNAVASWCQANPGRLAIMLCVEICSAAYVVDGSMETAVVNSLFGDGAGAVALITGGDFDSTRLWGKATKGRDFDRNSVTCPEVIRFASCVVSDAIDGMKFVWDDEHNKFNFMLALDVPYIVGANVEAVIDRLLGEAGLRRSEVAHWVVHSGGKKVIDTVKINLGLTTHDLRHTTSVLRDYGNMSSGSFLFSFERLMQEECVRHGDFGVMITMGPGTTIETALLRW